MLLNTKCILLQTTSGGLPLSQVEERMKQLEEVSLCVNFHTHTTRILLEGYIALNLMLVTDPKYQLEILIVIIMHNNIYALHHVYIAHVYNSNIQTVV